jgi:hypothetical protein
VQARPEIFLQGFQVCGQPASTSTERIVPDQVRWLCILLMSHVLGRVDVLKTRG